MTPENFKDKEPRFILEDYFKGDTRAWGIFQDRFGKLRREFYVDIEGKWDGKELVLNEDFKYSDGETDNRVWRITKLDEHTYEGRADDIIGTATGKSYGNALNWRYTMDLKGKNGKTLRVDFNDWMFLQEGGVLINRAKVKKFGIELGEVILFFTKEKAETAKQATSAMRTSAGQSISQAAQ